MKKISNNFLVFSLVYACGVLIYISLTAANQAKAATNHIVISQIQTAGATANDEFVELYNPTDTTINLAKWRLNRETQAGTSSATLVASMSGLIAPRGYFLVTSNESLASSSADLRYSNTGTHIASNNTVLLYSDAGLSLVDKVGLGTATDFETATIDNPGTNGSVIRKASASSTELTLTSDGAEASFGNGWDTDNNANDFVQVTTAFARNTASPQAQPTNTPTPIPTNTPTPTIAPTLTPSPTVKPTATPTPTLAPTNTPVPTAKPTLQPTATPTPTLTPTNTPMPTATPQPTPTMIPTGMPTAIPIIVPTSVPTYTPTPTQLPLPTPTPTGTVIVTEPVTPRLTIVCIQTTRDISILGLHFTLPSITCSLIRTLSK